MPQTNREQWFVTNISNITLSLGVMNMPVLRPGKIVDVLLYTDKATVEQSVDIKHFIVNGYITISQFADDNLVVTVNASNVDQLNDIVNPDLQTVINNSTITTSESPTITMPNFTLDLYGGNLLVGDGGGIYLAAGDIFMNMGGGIGGGDIYMDQGTLRNASLIESTEINTPTLLDDQGDFGFNFTSNTIVLTDADIDLNDQSLIVGDDSQINFIGTNIDGMIVFTSGTISTTTTYWDRDTLIFNDFKYIDLGQTQIFGLRTVNLPQPPTSPQPGEFYFSTTDNHFYGWNGTQWSQLD